MKRRAGFTVVELIITLTIMAILLTVSVVSARPILRIWQCFSKENTLEIMDLICLIMP